MEVLLVAAALGIPPGPAAAQAPNDPPGVEITSIANEGFMIADGDAKVLVDGLYDRGVRGYPTIPAELRLDLEAGRPPFDGIDLVLATHHHADHFDAAMVLRYLERHSGALFISTEQAVGRIRQAAGSGAEVLRRVRALAPMEGRPISLDVGRIRVTGLNLHHGRDRDPPVQNLGFLIELGGLMLLHIGDTEADVRDFAPYGLAEAGIDVAFLPSWFLTYDIWKRAVTESINPRQIIAMHLPHADAPPSWFGKSRTLTGLERAIAKAAPAPTVIFEPGESRRFEAAPARR